MNRKLNLKEIKKTFVLETSEIYDKLKKGANVNILGENASLYNIKQAFTDNVRQGQVKYLNFPIDNFQIQEFKNSRIRIVLLDFKNVIFFKEIADALKNYKILILTVNKGIEVDFIKKHSNFKLIYLKQFIYSDEKNISSLLVETILSFFHNSLNLGYYFKSFSRCASQKIILNQVKKNIILFPDISLREELAGLWLKIAVIFKQKLNFQDMVLELVSLSLFGFFFESILTGLSKADRKKNNQSDKIILILLNSFIFFFAGNLAVEYFEGNLTRDNLKEALGNILKSYSELK